MPVVPLISIQDHEGTILEKASTIISHKKYRLRLPERPFTGFLNPVNWDTNHRINVEISDFGR